MPGKYNDGVVMEAQQTTPRIAELTITTVKKIGVALDREGWTIGQLIDDRLKDEGEIKEFKLVFPD